MCAPVLLDRRVRYAVELCRTSLPLTEVSPALARGSWSRRGKLRTRVSEQRSCGAGDAYQDAFGVCEVTDNKPVR